MHTTLPNNGSDLRWTSPIHPASTSRHAPCNQETSDDGPPKMRTNLKSNRPVPKSSRHNSSRWFRAFSSTQPFPSEWKRVQFRMWTYWYWPWPSTIRLPSKQCLIHSIIDWKNADALRKWHKHKITMNWPEWLLCKQKPTPLTCRS